MLSIREERKGEERRSKREREREREGGRREKRRRRICHLIGREDEENIIPIGEENVIYQRRGEEERREEKRRRPHHPVPPGRLRLALNRESPKLSRRPFWMYWAGSHRPTASRVVLPEGESCFAALASAAADKALHPSRPLTGPRAWPLRLRASSAPNAPGQREAPQLRAHLHLPKIEGSKSTAPRIVTFSNIPGQPASPRTTST